MKFIDEANIEIQAGNGGDGIAAFRREKFVPKGGPSGGDGGKGGDVFVVADRNINTLVEYRFVRLYKAKNGDSGKGKDRYGKSGNDIILRMPVGTILTDSKNGRTVADLAHDGEKVLVALGGQGGLGNIHFKSSINRAPRQFTKGKLGEVLKVRLELKVLADVGLLGLPNAGKSTLIRSISAAKPKVAEYPFTTLHPILGTVRTDDNNSYVIADIPGLIRGAANGAGLGHQFLRHLKRTKLLLHILDAASICEKNNLLDEIAAIHEELKAYDKELSEKPRILVLNKIDLISTTAITELRNHAILAYSKLLNYPVKCFPISSLTGKGSKKLKFKLMDEIKNLKTRMGNAVAET